MSPKEPNQHQSSFRDPAGFIFEHKGAIYRQINKAGAEDYEHLMKSGLYDALIKEGLLISHKEVSLPKGVGRNKKLYKVIKPQQLPFISYPYEWTFPQLKDAALLTLKAQKLAREYGMILKDASAYNVQFIGKKPVFIDTLSFWRYTEGEPWEGYRQFCEHFIAPLALAAYGTPEILKAQRVFLDGIPLAVVAKLLPAKARIKSGLAAHIFLHAASQKRYDKLDATKPRTRHNVSPMALNGLMNSLERTVHKFRLPKRQTEWGEYYANTNYSKNAFEDKKKIISQMLKQVAPKTAWDLGANEGTFSSLAAAQGAYTIGFDVDSLAVEQNYLNKNSYPDLLLPLVQDLSNPTPSLGWAHKERHSLEERSPADVVMALALIHHLAITNHSPFSQIARYFSGLGRHLIIEFVPKEDSKVQLLLSAFSHNTFVGYTVENFEEAFGKYFELVDKKPVKDSKRVIYLYKAKA